MNDFLLFLNLVIAGLFTYDWIRSLLRYLDYGDARSLRNFTKSIVLTALAWSTFIRTVLFLLVGPTADSIIVTTLWGVALTGGIIMAVTWQREGLG